MDIDYLIIGQGIAGSLLAWELIQRNCKVIIVDNDQENASQVAAGLINPVTGMRLVKADSVDTLLPTARTLYRNLSRFFNRDFLIEKPMLRLLRSQNEIITSKKRLQDPKYLAYLGKIIAPDQLNYPFDNLIAVLEQKQTGYLLTRPLLASLKTHFINLNCYRDETLDYQEIQIHPTLQWRELKPKRIVFCEGFKVMHNPWFSNLPLQPAKGQILTLESVHSIPGKILNYGNWLAPISSNRFRIGATFERNNIDTAITSHGKQQLLQMLHQINSRLASATVVEQQANVRPCTRDRHPFIGHHPQHKGLWIFNGFGAKGSLQIPWYSQHLTDALLTGTPLHSHCNINRL